MKGQTTTWWREHRAQIFIVFAGALFILILLRLFSMQVINRPGFLRLANANRVRAEIIEPTRGGIFDRNGQLLVENRPSYTLYARPWAVKRNPRAISAVAATLDLEADVVSKRIKQRGWYTFQPATIQRDIEFTDYARLEAIRVDLPGIAFGFAPKRSYPLPEAVHLLGYVGERGDQTEVAGQARYGLVGKHGLELIYEPWLGGEPGIRYVEVDANEREIGTVSSPKSTPPKKGWDLWLNIDARLQRQAFDLMDGRKGSVVAIDPNDGAVLTMLSLPDYDPSHFAGVMPTDVWNSLLNDEGKPLLNRALQGQYPPGSTYKMAILAAGFEEGIVNDGFKVTCGGGMQLGRRFFRCWNRGGHGVVKWRDALKKSCDVFFYSLGLELGVDRMAEYARKFGFGSLTRVDFNVENRGVAPGFKYLDGKYGRGGWTRGQALNIAIGQGDVLATPMQLAVYTGAIATGLSVKPRLADRLVQPETGKVGRIEPSVKPVDISGETLRKIREAMRSVVNEPGGTAYWTRKLDIVTAGKTGTAQNPHGEDHGLFVGFAPYDNPVIAIAVVVEHGEHGSTSAAPIATKLMEYYIRDIYPGPYPMPIPWTPATTAGEDTLAQN